jgi:hypothetical protein
MNQTNGTDTGDPVFGGSIAIELVVCLAVVGVLAAILAAIMYLGEKCKEKKQRRQGIALANQVGDYDDL